MFDDHLWLPGPGAISMLESGEVDMGHVREEQRLSAGRVLVWGNSAGAIVTWDKQGLCKNVYIVLQ